MSKKLTPKQIEVLKRAANYQISAGTADAPRATVNNLVGRGLMTYDRDHFRYVLTEAGCAEIGLSMKEVTVNHARRQFDRQPSDTPTNLSYATPLSTTYLPYAAG